MSATKRASTDGVGGTIRRYLGAVTRDRRTAPRRPSAGLTTARFQRALDRLDARRVAVVFGVLQRSAPARECVEVGASACERFDDRGVPLVCGRAEGGQTVLARDVEVRARARERADTVELTSGRGNDKRGFAAMVHVVLIRSGGQKRVDARGSPLERGLRERGVTLRINVAVRVGFFGQQPS